MQDNLLNISKEELNKFSKEELIDQVIFPLIKRLIELEKENAELKSKLSQPKKNSKNSSKPPSTDNKPSNHEIKNKGGAKKDHKPHFRTLTENPDRTIFLPIEKCPNCGMDHGFKSNSYLTHQILELKSLEFEIIEYRRQKSTCAFGNKSVLAANPHGVLNNEIFGPRLKSFILLMYYENRLSYSKIKTLIESFSKTTISKAAIINVIKSCGKIFKSDYNEILNHLRNGEIIGIDETGWRVCGQNNWLWVFQNEDYTAFTIDKSRSSQVVHDTIGEYFNGALVSDFFSVYDKKVRAKNKQKCIAHLIRKLEYIYELSNRNPYSYAGCLLNLFRFAIYIRHHLDFNSKDFIDLRDYLADLLDCYLSFDVSNTEENTIQKRLVKYRSELLLFLYDKKVPATNNSSERALRPRVIHQKICNGNRSVSGKEAYEINSSLIETFKKQNKNIFEEFINLFKSKFVFEPKIKFSFQTFDSS